MAASLAAALPYAPGEANELTWQMCGKAPSAMQTFAHSIAGSMCFGVVRRSYRCMHASVVKRRAGEEAEGKLREKRVN